MNYSIDDFMCHWYEEYCSCPGEECRFRDTWWGVELHWAEGAD